MVPVSNLLKENGVVDPVKQSWSLHNELQGVKRELGDAKVVDAEIF